MDYTRITKSQVKFIQSLKLKKFRQKYNKYTIEGHKIIAELLSQQASQIELLIFTEKWLEKNETLVANFEGEFLLSGSKNMEMMSQFQHASDVMVMCNVSDDLLLRGQAPKGRFLYLEDLQDPGNCGAIFRSADWFGFDGVFMSPNTVDIYNNKVIQSSMGSIFRVKHRYISDEDFRSLKIPKYATTLGGKTLQLMEFPENYIICMGNEGQGLKSSTIDHCDDNILIDNQHSKGAESLNVAISSSIIMHYASLNRN